MEAPPPWEGGIRSLIRGINFLSSVFVTRENRQAEVKALLEKGIIPVEDDLKKHPEKSLSSRPWLTGRVAAQIHEVLPAKKIIEDMVEDAARILMHNASLVNPKAKL